MVKSQLVLLRIHILASGETDFDYESLKNNLKDDLSPNYILKFLDFTFSDINTMLLFTTYFQNLEVLLVEHFEEKNVLETIFQYLTKLQRLVLCNYNKPRHNICRHKEITSITLHHWLKSQNLLNRQLDHLTRFQIEEDESFLSLIHI